MKKTPVRFVQFKPTATYELKSHLCGTTLDMYGAFYWYDKRKLGVNYVGVGQRRNGLIELLRMKEQFAPSGLIYEIMPDGTKTLVVDERTGRVQIDKRGLQ